jgi:hypothetical protein
MGNVKDLLSELEGLEKWTSNGLKTDLNGLQMNLKWGM